MDMPHDVCAVRVRDGWEGRYALPGRNGKPRRICHVRGDDGARRVFPSAQAAEIAAARALVRELNAPLPKVEGRAREVRRTSRWARAEALFEGA